MELFIEFDVVFCGVDLISFCSLLSFEYCYIIICIFKFDLLINFLLFDI